ncbi:hypothetical protein OPV22_035102 [Ensete ventricosum]|uniref:glycerol-3-phosphate 1-O-acyltransferase n=1 Tax=Ensete ventricosum TaxID=4639 RepID=A0AAX5K9R6_ENSVE|nr:hypothetical protein OPV22_035102 [Ensete ventricosum]
MGAEEEVGYSRCFLRARNAEELLFCIRREVEAGKLSSEIATRLEELYYNYRNAVMQSGDPSAKWRSYFPIWLLHLIVFFWMLRILLAFHLVIRQYESLLTTTCLVKIISSH